MIRGTLQTSYLGTTSFLFASYDEATAFMRLAATYYEKEENDYDKPRIILEEVSDEDEV